MTIQELSDKFSIQELVANISIYGDNKDFKNQVRLFTENGISETISDGNVILKLEGRNVMEEAFNKFLKDYKKVYHLNGQQTITLDGDKASGTCYCLITLVDTENVKTIIGAIYTDEYVKINNEWLVDKRIGNFKWEEKE